MRWIFFLLILGLFAYELAALLGRTNGDTISEIVWDHTARRPIIPFLVGVLCGHFFWQRGAP